ncbi:hypothetical protein MATL_G00084880 [Megalops atlanticus]|uniref:Uncharacterized protein n=1 Tax=Megalops atlanticus TaxID=7932 RepID=A0A9D3Q3I6_MEGAT|nr:hypothetical protein MATL_G00084880 [Megalops atlanticus]
MKCPLPCLNICLSTSPDCPRQYAALKIVYRGLGAMWESPPYGMGAREEAWINTRGIHCHIQTFQKPPLMPRPGRAEAALHHTTDES